MHENIINITKLSKSEKKIFKLINNLNEIDPYEGIKKDKEFIIGEILPNLFYKIKLKSEVLPDNTYMYIIYTNRVVINKEGELSYIEPYKFIGIEDE